MCKQCTLIKYKPYSSLFITVDLTGFEGKVKKKKAEKYLVLT